MVYEYYKTVQILYFVVFSLIVFVVPLYDLKQFFYYICITYN